MIEWKDNKWGFLRETKEKAIEAGIDLDTGLHRTGLDEYLKVIFPNTNDWVHDKTIKDLPEGVKSKRRPDYRSKSLMLIVEFDGLQHYKDPSNIAKDVDSTKFYEGLGYKVVRIPYFIQLTNKVVKQLFGVEVSEALFDESVPSLGVKGKNTPAYLCGAGVERMAREFHKFPEQYKVNLDFLKSADEFYSGAELLKSIYDMYNDV